MKVEKREIRIRGIVLPIEWDTRGNATRTALFTPNEEEYLIEDNKNSKQLLGLIRKEVDVVGKVREEAGQRVITVGRCQTLKRRQTR
jgi:hypothetical protein